MTAAAILRALRAQRATLPAIATAIVGALLSVAGFFFIRAVDHGSLIYLPRGMASSSGHSWLPAAGLVCGFALTGLASHAVLTAVRTRARARRPEEDRAGPARKRSAAEPRAADRQAGVVGMDSGICNCLRWSQEGLRIFGYTDGVTDRSPQEWRERIHPDDRAATLAILEANQDKGIPFEMTYRIVLPDGTIRVIHEQIDPLRGQGGKRRRRARHDPGHHRVGSRPSGRCARARPASAASWSMRRSACS